MNKCKTETVNPIAKQQNFEQWYHFVTRTKFIHMHFATAIYRHCLRNGLAPIMYKNIEGIIFYSRRRQS